MSDRNLSVVELETATDEVPLFRITMNGFKPGTDEPVTATGDVDLLELTALAVGLRDAGLSVCRRRQAEITRALFKSLISGDLDDVIDVEPDEDEGDEPADEA